MQYQQTQSTYNCLNCNTRYSVYHLLMLCRTMYLANPMALNGNHPWRSLWLRLVTIHFRTNEVKILPNFNFMYLTQLLFFIIICVHNIRTLKADYNLNSCIILSADLVPVKIPSKKEKRKKYNNALQRCRRAAETSAAHKQTWTKLRESRSPGSRGLRREAVGKYARGRTTGWTERAASLFVGPTH